MTSSEELQRLLNETLIASPAIMALAYRVYDHVPEKPFGDKTAYISFGPIDSVEDDAECIAGIETTAQIDIWSRTPGQIEAKTLTDLVRKALHHKSLALSEHALVDTHVALTRVFPDPGGDHHGVVQVRCMIEEHG